MNFEIPVLNKLIEFPHRNLCIWSFLEPSEIIHFSDHQFRILSFVLIVVYRVYYSVVKCCAVKFVKKTHWSEFRKKVLRKKANSASNKWKGVFVENCIAKTIFFANFSIFLGYSVQGNHVPSRQGLWLFSGPVGLTRIVSIPVSKAVN